MWSKMLGCVVVCALAGWSGLGLAAANIVLAGGSTTTVEFLPGYAWVHPFADASIESKDVVKWIRFMSDKGTDHANLVLPKLKGVELDQARAPEGLTVTGAWSAEEATQIIRSLRWYPPSGASASGEVLASAGTDTPGAATEPPRTAVTVVVLPESTISPGCIRWVSWTGREGPRYPRRKSTTRRTRGPSGLLRMQFGPVIVTSNANHCFEWSKNIGKGDMPGVASGSGLHATVLVTQTPAFPDSASLAYQMQGELGPMGRRSNIPVSFAMAWSALDGDKPIDELLPGESGKTLYAHIVLKWKEGSDTKAARLPATAITIKEFNDAPVVELSFTSRMSGYGYTALWCSDLIGNSLDAGQDPTSDEKLSACIDDPSRRLWVNDISAAPLSLHLRTVFSEQVPWLGFGLDVATVVLEHKDLGNTLEGAAANTSVAPLQVSAGPDFVFKLGGRPMHFMVPFGFVVNEIGPTNKPRPMIGIAILTELFSVHKTDARTPTTKEGAP